MVVPIRSLCLCKPELRAMKSAFGRTLAQRSLSTAALTEPVPHNSRLPVRAVTTAQRPISPRRVDNHVARFQCVVAQSIEGIAWLTVVCIDGTMHPAIMLTGLITGMPSVT